MKKSDIRLLIASKKFVQSVQLRSINGIDYLVIGDTAQAVKSWQWVADQINSLEVVKKFEGGKLTDEQLAGVETLPEEKT
jgi:hypothetical protein